jgi:aminoglycoside 6'-N-acetyltransferase I
VALRIVDFADLTEVQYAEAADVLRDAFAHVPDAFDGGFEDEVASFITDERRAALAALDGDQVIGWIGVIQTYEHGWELHPLAVDPHRQGRGVGSDLVTALEARVRALGVLTLYLGTDDEFGGTNLYGADLFPDVAEKIAGIAQTSGHPFGFYRRLGYEVVGLLPDVNGPGRPDILMAKRL